MYEKNFERILLGKDHKICNIYMWSFSTNKNIKIKSAGWTFLLPIPDLGILREKKLWERDRKNLFLSSFQDRYFFYVMHGFGIYKMMTIEQMCPWLSWKKRKWPGK